MGLEAPRHKDEKTLLSTNEDFFARGYLMEVVKAPL